MPNEFRIVPSDVGVGPLRGRTYTPAFSDELGNRRVAHGRPGEPLLDVLEFTPALTDVSGFEPALRSRVAALGDVSPFSLAAVVSVEHPDGLGLSLITEHVPGRRLAELAPADLGAELALGVIRTATPVLAALNPTGVGAAHGALSAGRIVVEPDGKLIVVEHVLGWALEATGFSRAKLNEFGIVMPAGAMVRFDGRTDMVQLGFLALSIWLRRHLDPADFPDKVPELLNEAAAHEDPPEVTDGLRVWLERAMQIGPRPFTSAHDAVEALDELPGESDDTESETGLLAFHSEPSQPKPSPASGDQAAAFNVAQLRATIEQRQATSEAPAAPAPRIARHAAWILAVLCLVAIGEAVALGLLTFRQRTTNAAASGVGPVEPVDASLSASPPLTTPTTGPEAPQDIAAPPSVADREPSKAILPTIGSRLASGRFGGLTIASALDFLVSADGTPVGPKGAPIALQEGSHRLEFINDAVGFKQTQTVKVSYGQMTVVRVAMPTGRISVNASPWAEITIDGEGVGETPIANYALPVGTHEIVFRHPELGERRQTVVVKVGEYVRVTQAFDRSPRQGAR